MIQGELTTLRPATAADTERVEGLANGDAEAQALVVEEGGTPVGWVRYRRADRARQGGVDIELVRSAATRSRRSCST